MLGPEVAGGHESTIESTMLGPGRLLRDAWDDPGNHGFGHGGGPIGRQTDQHLVVAIGRERDGQSEHDGHQSTGLGRLHDARVLMGDDYEWAPLQR